MTEKRFTIHGNMVSDTDMKIPITLWSDKKQQKKFCDELNALHEENQQLKKENHNRRVLLVDELRGLFQMYLTQCRSISEEAIITLIRNDVKKRVFEVFDE